MLPAYFVQIRMLIGNEDPFQQLLMPGSICQLLENRRKNLTRAKEKVKTKASNVQTYFRDF
jgi:hypothetical protein